jgi:hypothetical protein
VWAIDLPLPGKTRQQKSYPFKGLTPVEKSYITVSNRNTDKNETTKVAGNFTERDWRCVDDVCTITTTIPKLDRNIYLRVRGTNTTQMEPEMDARGENPWPDLWFYSNPIFIETR